MSALRQALGQRIGRFAKRQKSPITALGFTVADGERGEVRLDVEEGRVRIWQGTNKIDVDGEAFFAGIAGLDQNS